MTKSATSETQLEIEKRAAHRLMHELGAEGVILITSHEDTESLYVSTVIGAHVSDAERLELARAFAGTLRKASIEVEQMIVDIVAADTARATAKRIKH